MPDKAKIAKAREINLRVAKCCGNCLSRTTIPMGLVEHCKLHSYLHQKHDGRRQMPAFRHFVCDDHDLDKVQMEREAGWYAGEEWLKGE